MLTNRAPSVLRHLLQSEASGGLVLMGAAALALVAANSPLSEHYFAILQSYIGPLSIGHWINDALMAIFFLLVGLEIKREMLDGQLSSWRRRILPGVAALGGMIVPAIIYVTFNWNHELTLRGWAIPTATDIAFALGVLSLLGSRIPTSLKVFLTALAIIDDLGAVVIVALFYAGDLSLSHLGAAAIVVVLLLALSRLGVARLWPYLLLGIVLWYMLLHSGVHATVAGVLLALTIPLNALRGRPDDVAGSPLHRLEQILQPWVAYAIVPAFGFANAGVAFGNMSLASATSSLTLGVSLGLVVGKLVGVFGSAYAVIRLGLADVPRDASLLQFIGVSVLCGIGFTMSLFIGLLAFTADPTLQEEVKIGILAGSTLSAVAGYTLLRFAPCEIRSARSRPAE